MPLTRRHTLTTIGTVLLAGCTFSGIGRAGNVILVENHLPTTRTATIIGIDQGSGDTLVDETITVPATGATTVPDPTDLEASTGAGTLIRADTPDTDQYAYEWGGGNGDVQQLRIHLRENAITFGIGPPTLPEETTES